MNENGFETGGRGRPPLQHHVEYNKQKWVRFHGASRFAFCETVGAHIRFFIFREVTMRIRQIHAMREL